MKFKGKVKHTHLNESSPTREDVTIVVYDKPSDTWGINLLVPNIDNLKLGDAVTISVIKETES